MDNEDHSTEREMRDAKVPTPESVEDLATYVSSLLDRPHDYGTCVYAMSMAATAAYNLIAHRLGVTGFQASCADLDILRRTRGWEAGILLNFNDALYPQYDLHQKLDEALKDSSGWLRDEAVKLLAKVDSNAERGPHPNVLAHWQKLAVSA